MNETTSISLDTPRYQDHGPLHMVGLRERFTMATLDGIPRLWQRFAPHIGSIRGQVDRTAYGVCLSVENCQDGFEYIAGVEVTDFAPPPQDWARLHIPPKRYAIFSHRGHVSTLRNTAHAIFSQWLPESGFEHASDSSDEPELLERYGEEFDAQTGTGGMEIWIPIKSARNEFLT